MTYGLPDATLQKLRSVFAQHPEVEEVLLYGSRAKGTYRPGSDIDITMKGALLTHAIQSKVWLEIDDLLLPCMIDLSILHQIGNPDLVEHINRVGQPLYKQANNRHDH
ncbi:MAG: nucleotidyltransferase domain-containing protein [Prevotellaceae bacterium]|jgi:predicted nucleotidyltransferase|nr:nucleotidyltransferase domain-containing protein [Prevotellaceae bacterium]